MTATVFPVRIFGTSGKTQPCSQPWAMIVHSMLSMVTGGAVMPRTHEPSHGAGQPQAVKKADITERQSLPSAMPPGMGDIPGKRALRGLMEYLSTLK
jgi:hypothetical protein